MKQIPTSGRATEADAELPAAARALQTILEDLDDARTHRARLVNEGKRVASKDDIRSQILEQAAKVSQGASGEVKPELFEDIFEKELRKYHRLVDEMRTHCEQQERILVTLEVGYLNSRSGFIATRALRLNGFAIYRNVITNSWPRGRTTLALDTEKRGYKRWNWHIGNGARSLLIARRVSRQAAIPDRWSACSSLTTARNSRQFHTLLATRLAQFKDSVQNWIYTRRSTME